MLRTTRKLPISIEQEIEEVLTEGHASINKLDAAYAQSQVTLFEVKKLLASYEQTFEKTAENKNTLNNIPK